MEWIGVWVGIRLEWIGAERIGVDRRDFRRDSLGVDLPLFRFRCGVDRSLARERIGAWIGVDRSDVRRVRRVWIVSGLEWIGAISVECVKLGSLLGHFPDRSLAASSRERIGVWVGAVKA